MEVVIESSLQYNQHVTKTVSDISIVYWLIRINITFLIGRRYFYINAFVFQKIVLFFHPVGQHL